MISNITPDPDAAHFDHGANFHRVSLRCGSCNGEAVGCHARPLSFSHARPAADAEAIGAAPCVDCGAFLPSGAVVLCGARSSIADEMRLAQGGAYREGRGAFRRAEQTPDGRYKFR